MRGTTYKTYKRHLSAGEYLRCTPASPMAAGLIFPEHEARIYPGLSSSLSVSAATAIFPPSLRA